MNELVIRADANAQIGTGHLMRCLALAQAWHARGGKAILVSHELSPALLERVRAEQISIVPTRAVSSLAEDAALLIETARTQNAEWIVVDGYHFDAKYQRAIKEAGFQLLVLDDNGACEYYYADFILNQNLHAVPDLYERREPYTQLLLGTRYALLRREFLEWQNWERQIPDMAKRVLVTLGGSDPQNVTLRVMEALNEIDIEGMESIVLIGATNPHAKELEDTAAQARVTMRVERNATNMPALMAWADVAIAGAGSTVWELAFMGLPSVVLPLAENQIGAAKHLADNLITHVLLHDFFCEDFAKVFAHLATNAQERCRLKDNGRRLVDGLGSRRVAKTMSDVMAYEYTS